MLDFAAYAGYGALIGLLIAFLSVPVALLGGLGVRLFSHDQESGLQKVKLVAHRVALLGLGIAALGALGAVVGIVTFYYWETMARS